MERDESVKDLMQRRERGELTPLEALLLARSTRGTPESPELLARVAALAGPLEALHARGGGAGAALEVLRAAQGSELAQLDRAEVVRVLSGDWTSVSSLVSASEVTKASGLVLEGLGERAKLGAIEQALARWVEQRLPDAPAREALALFERCEGAQAWWREAVQRAVAQASQARSVAWAQAVWRWWGQEPHHAVKVLRLIEHSAENEEWLVGQAPHEVAPEALAPLLAECRARRWPVLAATLLCAGSPLAERIKQMKPFGRTCPRRAVERILEGADDAEVIEKAQGSDWQPLLWAAARRTLKNPELFSKVTNPKRAAWLAVAHEKLGGVKVPESLRGRFNTCLEYDVSYTEASQDLQLKVLFLGASPTDASRTKYEEEVAAIDRRVRKARYRDLVKVHLGLAAQPSDLQSLLQEHRPHVVHFSGHAYEAAICLQGEKGDTAPVRAQDFAELMRICAEDVHVVVLNGCNTGAQAKSMVRYVDFAIGMEDATTGEAACLFAASFYGALASGTSLETAFGFAKNEPQLHGWMNSTGAPVKHVRAGFAAAEPFVFLPS